jgi:hypothetical protein
MTRLLDRREAPGQGAERLRDDPVDAGVEGDAREGERRTAPDAEVEEQPPERADRPYEVKAPQMVCDYYPNIPRTVQDRYLARDQSNPVPTFDGSPTRDQVVQGAVGDCSIVAAIGSVAEHQGESRVRPGMDRSTQTGGRPGPRERQAQTTGTVP